MPRIQILHAEGCEEAASALSTAVDVLRALGLPGSAELRAARPDSFARLRPTPGSPIVLVDGRGVDPSFSNPAGPTGHGTQAGPPPRWLIEALLLNALAPKGYLFMCVANSARSQIAEGLARRRLPQSVSIQSAGSRPTSLRAEAVQVLQEVGIDASRQYAKSLDAVDTSLVEVVVTLCAEEVCPVFPGKVRRVHWGLPDPAAVDGHPEVRLNAFRATRDELDRRLQVLGGYAVVTP